MQQLDSLQAWRSARLVALSAYRLTMEGPLERHFGFADQIRWAAVSIPANIVEGYALGTPAQLIKHLRFALASAAELRCHLELATELELVGSDRSSGVVKDCSRVIALLVGLLRHLGARVPSRNPILQ